MNAEQIDALLKVRSQLLSLRDLEHGVDTSPIDAVLREVPPGENNDVDLALGRTCATLPARTDYGLGNREIGAVQALIDTTRLLWREAEPIEY
jgi:hypothetical protein